MTSLVVRGVMWLRGVFLGLAVGVGLLYGPAAAQEIPPAPEPVAQVGPAAISEEEFEHWFTQAAHSHFGRAMELVPPRYDRCVAAKRRQRVAKGWLWLNESALRERCAQDHRSLGRMTMQFLIHAQWVEQEAARQGIEVSERRVTRLFERQRRLAFPGRGGYERFLRESGASEDGIKYRVRLDALQNRITRRITARVKPVTERDIARYRARHPRGLAGLDRAKADRRVRSLLLSQREQLSLQSFIEGFRERSRAVTWCAAGYEIAECGVTAPPPVTSVASK